MNSHGQALAYLLERTGGLDVLVNNAGICDDGPIEDQSLDDRLRVIDVDLISVLDTCRLAPRFCWLHARQRHQCRDCQLIDPERQHRASRSMSVRYVACRSQVLPSRQAARDTSGRSHPC